jgi:hypothetical protein
MCLHCKPQKYKFHEYVRMLKDLKHEKITWIGYIGHYIKWWKISIKPKK